MDRGTMVTEVRQRLGEDIEDFWKNTHIIRMLDEGVRRFAHEEKWHWLYTIQEGIVVASGATSLSLEPDIVPNRHFALLLVSGDTVLAPARVPPGDGARLRTLGRKGQPEFYFIAPTTAGANTLYLTPPADRAYTAEYHFIREPAPMDDDADVPDMPTAYHDGVVAWATGMLWLKELNASSKAQEQFAIYREVLEQARSDQKKLAIDEAVVWGQEDPLPYRLSKREFYERHLPQNL